MASDTFGGFCVLATGICAVNPTTPHAMTRERNFIPNLLLEGLCLGDDMSDKIMLSGTQGQLHLISSEIEGRVDFHFSGYRAYQTYCEAV
jgi:hypothetical protein